MSLKNLQDRIGKLENVLGVNQPPIILTVRFINPDGETEPLTPEETAALEAYKEQLCREAVGSPDISCVFWTREQAQALIAQKGQDPTITTREVKA